MNYETIIELSNVTLGDCLDMYKMKNMITIINDGRIINFEKEENKQKRRKDMKVNIKKLNEQEGVNR